jgi:acyl dehydratase
MGETIRARDLPSLVGRTYGPSAWIEITQGRVNHFADATGDHQFIHVDPERAARTPFGGTIAHGFLTLSLLPQLTAGHGPQVAGLQMGLNYGSDKVRFLQPVRVGSRIRARQTLVAVTEKQAGQWLAKFAVEVEIENQDKPALIAEALALYIVNDPADQQGDKSHA